MITLAFTYPVWQNKDNWNNEEHSTRTFSMLRNFSHCRSHWIPTLAAELQQRYLSEIPRSLSFEAGRIRSIGVTRTIVLQIIIIITFTKDNKMRTIGRFRAFWNIRHCQAHLIYAMLCKYATKTPIWYNLVIGSSDKCFVVKKCNKDTHQRFQD